MWNSNSVKSDLETQTQNTVQIKASDAVGLDRKNERSSPVVIQGVAGTAAKPGGAPRQWGGYFNPSSLSRGRNLGQSSQTFFFSRELMEICIFRVKHLDG